MHNVRRLFWTSGLIVAAAAVVALARPAAAHDGRRFEILVIDNQLFVQGYLSTGIDDGGGLTRPYYNALHDHWHNITSSVAIADLPGYDLFVPGPLVGFDLSLELLGASKWVNPPAMPAPGTIPNLVPLGVGDTIDVEFDSMTIDTDTLGTFPLAAAIGGGGAADLDLIYSIEQNPTGVIYALRWQLSTNAPGIAPSSTIYTLFSPDGADATEKLHHASLYLENYLGIVPEPSSIALAGLGSTALVALAWRRKRRGRSSADCPRA